MKKKLGGSTPWGIWRMAGCEGHNLEIWLSFTRLIALLRVMERREREMLLFLTFLPSEL